jgi:hypothetical protein
VSNIFTVSLHFIVPVVELSQVIRFDCYVNPVRVSVIDIFR